MNNLLYKREILEGCYNGMFSSAQWQGYSFEFVQEFCIMLLMHRHPMHRELDSVPRDYSTCQGFDMVVAEKASNDEDEIKSITHDELEDAESEEEKETKEKDYSDEINVDGYYDKTNEI